MAQPKQNEKPQTQNEDSVQCRHVRVLKEFGAAPLLTLLLFLQWWESRHEQQPPSSLLPLVTSSPYVLFQILQIYFIFWLSPLAVSLQEKRKYFCPKWCCLRPACHAVARPARWPCPGRRTHCWGLCTECPSSAAVSGASGLSVDSDPLLYASPLPLSHMVPAWCSVVLAVSCFQTASPEKELSFPYTCRIVSSLFCLGKLQAFCCVAFRLPPFLLSSEGVCWSALFWLLQVRLKYRWLRSCPVTASRQAHTSFVVTPSLPARDLEVRWEWSWLLCPTAAFPPHLPSLLSFTLLFSLVSTPTSRSTSLLATEAALDTQSSSAFLQVGEELTGHLSRCWQSSSGNQSAKVPALPSFEEAVCWGQGWGMGRGDEAGDGTSQGSFLPRFPSWMFLANRWSLHWK